MTRVLVLLALLFTQAAHVQGAHAQGAQAQGMPDEPAFTEHRLALQISDNTAAEQALVLSVAANVLKAYGLDKVAIEVVAFGPGLDLLNRDNPNASKIQDLVRQGVRFDACLNTIATIERETGKPFPLNPNAHGVEAGIVQIITLVEHGYTNVRP